MKTARLFRVVWRINAVLLLAAGVLALGAVLVALVASLSWGAHREAEPPLAVAEQGERLFLGSAQVVGGTPFVLLPLESRRYAKGFSSGGDEHTTRNLLFHDTRSGESRWLRPDHRTEILDFTLLQGSGGARPRWNREAAPTEDPVRWIRYELATPGPGGGGGEAPRQLAVSGPGGEQLTVVLEGVDEVLGYTPAQEGRLVVFYRQGADYFAGEVDLEQRKVARTRPIPRS
jgi:hypothetical protein